MERCFYDPNGQLLSASFMDYAMPRACDFPFFTTALSEVPSTNHPLGFRGGGEGVYTRTRCHRERHRRCRGRPGVTHIDSRRHPSALAGDRRSGKRT